MNLTLPEASNNIDDGTLPDEGPGESGREPAKPGALRLVQADKTRVEAIRKKLVGNWRLVSFESVGKDGKTSRVEMVGRIMYDAQDNMAAQLMPTGKKDETESTRRPNYIAYFGTYEIDPDNETLIHRPEGATISRWVGAEQVRHYAFKDNLLTLTMRMGDRVVGILTWEPIR